MKTAATHIIERMKLFTHRHQIAPDARILCALSGGIDSMVMTHALLHLDYTCAVAHCNFTLRGAESDGDELFVTDWALKQDIDCFVNRFDTKKYAAEQGISIQMAARKLRYDWFAGIMAEAAYDYLALAHHADDALETVLINLCRGTGIQGISGIPEINGNIIRPLIDARRNEISAYSKKFKIKYRNDSSNNEIKYHRNLIRHRIIPLFQEINPAFCETMIDNIGRFKQVAGLSEQAGEILYRECVQHVDGRNVISLDKITNEHIENGSFFNLLMRCDLPASISGEVAKLIHSQPGRFVEWGDTEVLRDRQSIIIRRKEKMADSEETLVYHDTRFLSDPLVLHIETVRRKQIMNIPDDSRIACLDYSKLQFPLIIRKWQHGDRFIPLGMRRFKKLSNFFTDIKLSKFDKENVYVLCSGHEIVWVIGYRIDDRVKIEKNTEKALVLSL